MSHNRKKSIPRENNKMAENGIAVIKRLLRDFTKINIKIIRNAVIVNEVSQIN